MRIKILEKDIRKLVTDYLNIHKWFHYWNMQGLGSYPGVPDVIATKNGRTLFIELKTPNGKMRPAQTQFQHDMITHGGEYVVVRSFEDIEQVTGEQKSQTT